MYLILSPLLGILLGVSLAAPPGPITSMIINRAYRGWLGAVKVGLGAMTADFILMILTISIGTEFDLVKYVRYIYPIGAAFFIYLAYSILKEKTAGKLDAELNGGYFAGVSVGILNPLQIGWWLTAGMGVYDRFGIITIVFLFLGALLWVFVLVYVIRYASRKFESKMEIWIKLFSSGFLLIFGAIFIFLFVS
jgi:threonine/homoserine/homoserine lactone efflux protein